MKLKWFHCVLIALYATALPTWFLDYDDMTLLDWIIDDLREYILVPSVYFIVYRFIPYKYFIAKLAAWLSGFVAVFNLLNYLAHIHSQETSLYWNIGFYVFMAATSYLALHNYIRYNRIRNKSSVYDPSKTYIARKRPITMRSLFVAAVYRWPMNTVSIIHEGRWYKMKGEFREILVDEGKLSSYYLEEIKPNERLVKNIQSSIGLKFNLLRMNCYCVVTRIVSNS